MSELAEGAVTIRELVTKLGFNVDEQKLKGFERGLETAKAAAEALSLVWTGLVGTLFELTRETAEYGEEVEINSQLLGITTEKFQKLRYAAQAFGIENENIITGLRFFNKNLGDAQHGMGEGGIAFNRLGLSVRALKNEPVDQVLAKVADKLHGVTDASERAAISVKLFGRSGAHFGQFLAQGSGVIGAMGDQLNGLFMTEEQVAAGQKTHAALIQTKAILEALRNEVGVRLFPVVQKLSKAFLDWVMANKTLIEQRIDHYVGLITTAVGAAWSMATKAVAVVRDLIRHLGGLDNALKILGITLGAIFSARILGSIREGIKELRELGLVGLLDEAEILLIPAAIVAVVLALDDLRNYLAGNDSVLGTLVGPFSELKKKFADLAEPIRVFIDGFKEVARSVGAVFKDGFGAFLDLWKGDFKRFLTVDLPQLFKDNVGIFEGLGKIVGGGIITGLRGMRDEILGAIFPPQLTTILRHVLAFGGGMASGGPMAGLLSLLANQVGHNVGAQIPWAQMGADVSGAWQGAAANLGLSRGSPTIQTHVTLEMPPGTPQSHADYVKQGAEAIFNTMFNQKLFHAVQNAPAGA